MALTNQDHHVAQQIDQFVQNILLKGGGDEVILANMFPYILHFWVLYV